MTKAGFFEHKKVHIVVLLLASLSIAFLAHFFFFTEFLEERFMTGRNDGLSQMIPFKHLLYNEITSGNFFYSNGFGFGGGTFSQLGYYFSTSIVFMLTVAITFLLETMNVIGKPDVLYWANAILFVSIARMTVVILLTIGYFRYIKFKPIPAFVGAVLYGTSIIYFRHVTYWEFFADAMIFLPLLLFGAEKVIREKNALWFVAAVSLSMIDNFYFAYINFLVAGMYILLRWMIPLSENEVKKMQQVKIFLLSGIAGFGISAVFFIPSVYGYLNNHRPPYEGEIPLFGVVDNLLLNSRIVMLPVFAVICLLLFAFYKIRIFRFFASLTLLLAVMHYSPVVGSLFNGLSAPQYRWEYFMSLTVAGVVAVSLQQFSTVKIKQLVIAISITASLYTFAYWVDPTLVISILLDNYQLAGILLTFAAVLLYTWKKEKWTLVLLTSLVLVTSLLSANIYQKQTLTYNKGTTYGITKEFMMSEAYYGKDQRQLINMIQAEESDPLARIDWMARGRNNTPIVQEFKGMSVYSSILNKELLTFYLTDLRIAMGRESVSRYASLGDRANLYSVLSGKYYIAEKPKKAIPYGFSRFAEVGDFVAYKNDYILPFVRTTKKVFSETDLENASPIAKERAMLEGIIVDEGKGNPIPESLNIIKQTKIEEVASTYQENKLTVLGDEGGLDLVLTNPSEDDSDYFISFFIEGIEHDESFKLKVNEFNTYRKRSTSIYRTNMNDITIRVSHTDRISIRLPKGNYTIANFELHEENYELLKTLKGASELEPEVPVVWEGGRVALAYDNNTGQTHMTLPIPFEKGWTAKINGQKQKIERANYAFTGLKLKEGMNDIELTYYPPHFFPALLCSILSLLLTFFLLRKYRLSSSINE
ncbi:YfhO family protein [Sporosarcina limicola]|uniref:Membrane protein YfhO n=1 Tax=Sporosarcina limicola TaxID=34101 RepID=A0A927R1W5_9BACL|nr:YfhO family protein [Sporosarcina limicola]MBE1553231.1 putative membrane protein YfhO [Sporosarcina limicola]